MEEIEITGQVRNVAARILGANASDITPDTSFTDDLGADSLDVVELIVELEEMFDLKISNEDADNMKTVGDVVRYIEKIRH